MHESGTGRRFAEIAVVPVADAQRATVYEHGWQSWSPAGAYPASTHRSPRPRRAIWQTMAFRPGHPAPDDGFQGEGLLAVSTDGPAGPTRTWVASDPTRSVASIRATVRDGRVSVSADGPVVEVGPSSTLDDALGMAALHLAAATPPRPERPMGPGWCSWYGSWHEVTDAVVEESVAIIDREDLDIRLIQIDDGHQAGIGDWLSPSGRIRDMAALARRIRDGGREAGVWTAPFLVGADSELARRHPDWLIPDAVAAERHWGQRVGVLDTTHPDAADHLATVFRTLRSWGYTFHKIDFLYGGAMAGTRRDDVGPIAAYRAGLQIIRDAVGEDATILGCGAPLLPSIGLVDAMRISPDTDHRREPPDGDISQPSLRGALAAGRARAWMHGRLWVNDPDCLLVTPRAEDRDVRVAHLGAYGGLALSGDRLAELDSAGLAMTRQVLRPSTPGPVRWDATAGPDGGTIHGSSEVPT